MATTRDDGAMSGRMAQGVVLRWRRFSASRRQRCEREQVESRTRSAVAESSSGLIRTIGRWSLAALIVNSVLGGGVFGLPSVVAGRLGKYGALAYLVSAAGIALIAACLSEVASQFRETGGPYLYARTALGRFWGIQIAWMTWLARLTAASGTANLFATYLAGICAARGPAVLSSDNPVGADRNPRGD